MSLWCTRRFLPIIVLGLGCSFACRPSAKDWPWVVELGGVRLNVEVADTPGKRDHGLMFRDKLGENWGMLFVYETEETLVFWMKNTTIPLSIAFIDRGLVVRDVQDMTPLSEEMHPSSVPAAYALEVERGWFARHGVRPGTAVRFSPELDRLVRERRQGG